MEREASWQAALDSSIRAGFRTHPLDTALTATDWSHLSAEEPPLPVRTFTELWAQQSAQHAVEPWRILVESAASVTPGIRDELDGVAEPSALGPLRALLARVEQAAVVFGHPGNWTSPDQWAYLLQVRHAQRADAYEHVLLHPPASEQDLAQVEHVLAVPLPHSYHRFLLLTNGLGLGERELSYVCGAGPRRAAWPAVQLNQWMECARQHEIAAAWREFQGIYAYERIMDRERGENTFGSDETALIPFASTFDAWCFDRTRPDSAGEYPIVLWDHEARAATEHYPQFDAWFADEVEPYLFDDV
ncbi:MAG TPA: SMI1/KNR4 family protein [Ktedonobacterales bacterium]